MAHMSISDISKGVLALLHVGTHAGLKIKGAGRTKEPVKMPHIYSSTGCVAKFLGIVCNHWTEPEEVMCTKYQIVELAKGSSPIDLV